MGYLSQSDLDAIRSNPSSVVNYYDATRAEFIADLGMPGLSEAALQAAFCCVIAYSLVPYGPETPAADLAAILAQPTLACDLYVTLTWYLLAEFGISTDDQAAVGWDGEVVGNHAQLLFSDGTSNLLLDPTIGLVVNNATIEGLVDGTSYTQMTSFYDRHDLDSFNSAVIAAVGHGSYKASDAIYYVPTLDNWLDHYSDYQGLTIEHGSDSQTIVGSLYDDSIDAGAGDDFVYGGKGDDHLYGGDGNDIVAGGFGTDFLDGGNGYDQALFSGSLSQYLIIQTGSTLTVSSPEDTHTLVDIEELKFSDQIVPLVVNTVTVTDTGDQFAWSTITKNYGGKDDVLDIAYHLDDGTDVNYQYDALDQFSWANIVTSYDSASIKASVTYHNDDNSSVTYEYDTSGQSSWSNIRYDLSDQGERTSVAYDYRDDRDVIYQYDAHDQFNWASIRSDYDNQQNRTTIVYEMDDGTHTAYQYDVLDQFSWISVRSDYDDQWNRTTIVYDNDDATHTAYQYDTLGQLAWNSIQSEYSTQWERTSITYNNDDGSQISYQYDVGNMFSWASVEYDYDNNSHLRSTAYHNDDGSLLIVA